MHKTFSTTALFILATLTAPASADHLTALSNLTCPSDGALRCGDVSIYREQNGTTYLREYYGTGHHGNHHFTDRLKDGYQALYVYDKNMALIQNGSYTQVPNNGVPLIGLTANVEYKSTYQIFKKGDLWADVTKTCIAGSDLKKVPANTFPANKMTCTSKSEYVSGRIATRSDIYWFYIPSQQIVASAGEDLADTGTWGAELIAYFPVTR